MRISALALLLAAPPLAAQIDLAPTAARLAVPDAVVWDAGALEASTRTYKMRFGDDGATFVPFLGAAAPDSYPVRFRLERATVHGEPVAGVAHDRAPARHGDVVDFDRGFANERYALHHDAVEQSFVLAELPRRGRIVLAITVTTELAARWCGDELRFENEHGHVAYGPACAFDAAGRRTHVDRTWRDGCIELALSEEFVAAARLPIVVDPEIAGSRHHLHGESAELRTPDVASDGSRTLVVAERVFSATDSDVLAIVLDPAGVPQTFGWIDLSADSFQHPRVAYNFLAHRYLVVAQRSANSASPFSIHGRCVDAASPYTGGSWVAIADASLPGHAAGDKIHPDVGGDPSPSAPTYFTVVWERVWTAYDHDIHMKQTTADPDPVLRSASPALVDNSPETQILPAISTGNGPPPAHEQAWCIVYDSGPSSPAIVAAIVAWDGTVTHSGIHVTAGASTGHGPRVSSPAEFTDVDGRRFLVVTTQQISPFSNHDVFGALVGSRGRVGLLHDLTNLEHEDPLQPHCGLEQLEAAADTDGCRYAVTYAEHGPFDFDVRISTFEPVTAGSGTLQVVDNRVLVGPRASHEQQPAIASRYSGGGRGPVHAIVWRDDNGTSDNLLVHTLYESTSPGQRFVVLGTGCGGLGIHAFGVPGLCSTFEVESPSADGVLFGRPWSPPIELLGFLCSVPCALGVDPFFTQHAPALPVSVPCTRGLVGLTFAAQGFRGPGNGPCYGGLTLGDTLLVTIR